MKKLCLLLCACLLLCVYPAIAADPTSQPLQKFSGSFYDSFDTITQLIGFAASQKEFDATLAETRTLMRHYHQIFDGYNAYAGVNNLWFVNCYAAQGPTPAEPELIELLLWVKENQKDTRVNVALGAVLSVWHEYRTTGEEVPPVELLREKSLHVDMDDVIINEEEGTVYFRDPELSLDLGAVAKGYAVEKVAAMLAERMPSYILNAGGNVRCGGQPQDGRARWGISIQNPDGNDYLDVLYLTDQSIVTSGDYQRYYEVDGVRYHHIIDPDTLMPARFMRSVTVVTRDSGWADLLSTALYLMPYEESRAFVDALPGVEAFWALNDGTIQYSDGLKTILLSAGASARDEN